MPIEQLIKHPALKPTILIRDALENVYRPAGVETQDGDKDLAPAPHPAPARERHRAA